MNHLFAYSALTLASLLSVPTTFAAKTTCAQIRTGSLYPEGKEHFYKITLLPETPLREGKVSEFSLVNESDQAEEDVKASLEISIKKFMFFYETTEPLARVRGQSIPLYAHTQVYAVSANLTSSKYDLGTVSGGDYWPPTKTIDRDLICNSEEIFAKTETEFLGYDQCANDDARKPVCVGIGSRSEAWLINGMTQYASCAQKTVECVAKGSRSEGWSAYKKVIQE